MCFLSALKNSLKYQYLESSDSIPFNYRPSFFNMGSPEDAQGSDTASRMSHFSNQFSIQHERLILELLPFKDSGKFHEWLRGGMVKGSWTEFHQDFLIMVPGDHTEPDKNKTAQAVKDAINSKSPKFLTYHPDKTNWTNEDHYVRFITTIILDNMLTGLWSDSDWKKRNIDIAKAVYEVLFFLKASYLMADQHPPLYTQ